MRDFLFVFSDDGSIVKTETDERAQFDSVGCVR